jgi:hypothetical protein
VQAWQEVWKTLFDLRDSFANTEKNGLFRLHDVPPSRCQARIRVVRGNIQDGSRQMHET